LRLETVVPALLRTSRGKNEARRTRVSGRIPSVVYGAFKEPVAISLNPKDITKIIHSKTGHNSIFDLAIEGGETTPVIVADEAYDPIKGSLLHVDLRRIDLTRKLRVSVPVHISGEAKGVKQQGGILEVATRAIEIECIPDDIPNNFDVNVTELMIGDSIRISDLALKEGVKVLTAADAVIAHIVGVKEEAPKEGDAKPEPEVAAKKGKKEEKVAAPAAPAAKAPAAKKK
jgi:large subunit ribosomal protein L25